MYIPLMRVVSVKTWKWYGSLFWKSTISRKPGGKMRSFCENRAMSVFSSPKNIFWRKKNFIDFFFNFWKFSFFIKNTYKSCRKIGKMNQNRSKMAQNQDFAISVRFFRVCISNGPIFLKSGESFFGIVARFHSDFWKNSMCQFDFLARF